MHPFRTHASTPAWQAGDFACQAHFWCLEPLQLGIWNPIVKKSFKKNPPKGMDFLENILQHRFPFCLVSLWVSIITKDFFVSEVTSILAAIWTTHVLEWRIGMKQSRRKNRSTTLVRCFLRQQTLRNRCLASKKGKQVPKLKTNPHQNLLKLEVNKTLD